jgi:hypothetical protein
MDSSKGSERALRLRADQWPGWCLCDIRLVVHHHVTASRRAEIDWVDVGSVVVRDTHVVADDVDARRTPAADVVVGVDELSARVLFVVENVDWTGSTAIQTDRTATAAKD